MKKTGFFSTGKDKEMRFRLFSHLPLLALLVVSVLLWPSLAASGTYYVSLTGNDAWRGTRPDSAWRHIAYAASRVVAGDSVLVLGGTYNERVTIANSGSPGQWITFTPFPGNTVTIDGTGIPVPAGEGLVYINSKTVSKNYIKISGFRVINAERLGAGIMIRGESASWSHIIIEKNYTYNTGSSGIQALGPGRNVIIDGNEIELAANPPDTTMWSQECLSVSGWGVDTFEIKNNEVHHNGGWYNPAKWRGGEGIDAKDGVRNGKIYGNNVHHLGREWDTQVGIYVDAFSQFASNVGIFNNIVHDMKGLGYAVGSENGGTTEYIRLYNNIAYTNMRSGITVSGYGVPHGPLRDITIINNTVYNNNISQAGDGKGIEIGDPFVPNLVIRNNVVSKNFGCQIAIADPVGTTIDHNLIDGPTRVYGRDSVVGDPQFVDTTNANFHLRSTSSAIDRGSALGAPSFDFDGTPRPQGAGYDIGAFEYRLSGAEEGPDQRLMVKGQGYRATPNPFTSFATIPGHEGERFALYDVTGRKVGMFKGDRIGEGLTPGVYFLRPESKNAKPLRIVKVR